MKKIPVRHIAENRNDLHAAAKFTIRSVADLLNGNDLVQELHRHDFFFILFLQKGRGIHEIDFTKYKILDNTVFFLRPGQVHQLQLKAGCTGYLVEFNAGFYHPKEQLSNQRLRKASNKNYCELDMSRFDKLQHILASMFNEYAAKEEGYLDFIRSSLDIFLIEFVRQSPNPKPGAIQMNSYTQERFEEFLALLDKNISTHKKVSHYTNVMSLSLYQLNEITRSSIDKTASELINEHIILDAKRYLLATSNQVKDIADILGYEDSSYFIRFFKKHTGQAPEVFRHNFK